MKITAKMTLDRVQPYAKASWKIPIVTKSDHPRFIKGARFDWGFVQIALREGYTVEIVP